MILSSYVSKVNSERDTLEYSISPELCCTGAPTIVSFMVSLPDFLLAVQSRNLIYTSLVWDTIVLKYKAIVLMVVCLASQDILSINMHFDTILLFLNVKIIFRVV